MRLIDADALIDKINKIYKDLETLDKGIFYPAHYELGAIRSIIYHIDKQPTIETVRCKECIHYVEEDGMCDETYSVAYPDEFCSHGERSE